MTHKYCLMTHRPSFTLKLVSHSTIYPKTYPWDLHQKVNSKKNCKMSGCIAKYLFRLCSVRFLKFMWRTRATTRNAIRSPMMSNATWIIYGQKWNFSFCNGKNVTHHLWSDPLAHFPVSTPPFGTSTVRLGWWEKQVSKLKFISFGMEK